MSIIIKQINMESDKGEEKQISKCVQCDSTNVVFEKIDDGNWIEEGLLCQDCGAHMVWGGDSEYILRITDREEWIELFKDILQFPFDAEVCEPQDVSFILIGDKVKVHGIEMEDDLYGVIVSIRKERKKYAFPLVDLKPLIHRKKSKIYVMHTNTGFVMKDRVNKIDGAKRNNNVIKAMIKSGIVGNRVKGIRA